MSSAAPKKLWGGRFTGAVDPLMDAFNASIHFDRRMYAADIIGSIVYSKALAKNGIISEQERDLLIEGLEKVQDEWEKNTFQLKPGDEDIHTANERRLGELIGSVAGKLHTGRSRNDQVATDMRIWIREEASKILAHVKELISVAVSRAERETDVIMPGYTHLQVSQNAYKVSQQTVRVSNHTCSVLNLSAGHICCCLMLGCGRPTLNVSVNILSVLTIYLLVQELWLDTFSTSIVILWQRSLVLPASFKTLSMPSVIEISSLNSSSGLPSQWCTFPASPKILSFTPVVNSDSFNLPMLIALAPV